MARTDNKKSEKVPKKCIAHNCGNRDKIQYVPVNSIICTFCKQPTLHPTRRIIAITNKEKKRPKKPPKCNLCGGLLPRGQVSPCIKCRGEKRLGCRR